VMSRSNDIRRRIGKTAIEADKEKMIRKNRHKRNMGSGK